MAGWQRSDRAQRRPSAPARAPKRDLEERLFYRRRASPRFYTAKTHKRHPRLWVAAAQNGPVAYSAGRFFLISLAA
jgi:hypothetical protein